MNQIFPLPKIPNCALIICNFYILYTSLSQVLVVDKGLVSSFGLLWKFVCSLQQRSVIGVSCSSLGAFAASLSKGLMSVCKTEPCQVRGFLESAKKFCPFSGKALSWCSLHLKHKCFSTTTCLVSLQVRCSPGGLCGRFPSICPALA